MGKWEEKYAQWKEQNLQRLQKKREERREDKCEWHLVGRGVPETGLRKHRAF